MITLPRLACANAAPRDMADAAMALEHTRADMRRDLRVRCAADPFRHTAADKVARARFDGEDDFWRGRRLRGQGGICSRGRTVFHLTGHQNIRGDGVRIVELHVMLRAEHHDQLDQIAHFGLGQIG